MNPLTNRVKEDAEELNIRAAKTVLNRTLKSLDEHEAEIIQAKKKEDRANAAGLVFGILGVALAAAAVVIGTVAAAKEVKELVEEEDRRIRQEENKELYRKLAVIKGRV